MNFIKHACKKSFTNLFAAVSEASEIKHSIRRKFVVIFTVIVMVLGSMNFTTFLIMDSSAGKLSNMIDASIHINTIINEAKNISEGTDTNNNASYISSYRLVAVVNPENEDSLKFKKKINEGLFNIENSLTSLERDYVRNQSSIETVEQTRKIFLSFKDSVNNIFHDFETRDISNAVPATDKISKVGSFLVGSAQDIMSKELTISQQQKAELGRQSALTGMIINIAIISIGLLSIFFAYILTKRITGTISRLAEISQNVAEGNLQVESLGISSRDEISVLTRAFNTMTENIRSLIKEIAESSSRVTHSSELLKVGTEQNTRAIELIAAATQQVSFEAEDQSKKSQETADVIHEMLKGNKRIYENAHMVLSTADRATNAANAGNEKMEQLLKQISTIEIKITGTQSTTESLKGQTKEIKTILDSISRIASQTNLLSLNAAIEAARAGEHGRSFAVVAEEIRKLAIDTTNAAGEITSILREIQKQSENVAESMTTGVSEVRGGMAIAYEARVAFEDIVKTSVEVENQVRLITGEIEKMTGEIERVESISRRISESAKSTSSGNQEVAAAIEEQTAGLQEILSLSYKLSEMSDHLQNAIGRFTL